ncbi:hypothetical protein NPX99_08065 [Bartonella sp. 220]|uniref:hypothetical protein n=1 Tax=Bartonella sp. 220B TaxID=2967260 RepID=UPI0022A97684|nr:hypothetical protein [Bartonella sp. 220B]MCZ2159198.1 hypothetical protein [Bartonella sp. 220B]
MSTITVSKIVSKKYELTNETHVVGNRTLYRIKALRDFGDIKAGDLGGFIENENNLSHDGNCWVYDDAWVADKGVVSDNAQIFNYASVFDNAKVCDDAKVFDCAKIYDNAKITGGTYICDKVSVFGNSYIDTKKLNGNIKICDQSIKDAA